MLRFGISVLFYPLEFTITLFQIICSIFPYFCRIVLLLSSGKSKHFLPVCVYYLMKILIMYVFQDYLLAFYSHFPSSIAVRQLWQYAQMTSSGKFQKFDYGKDINLVEYNQETPPLYNLSNIQIPVYMFFGRHDILLKEEVDEIKNMK